MRTYRALLLYRELVMAKMHKNDSIGLLAAEIRKAYCEAKSMGVYLRLFELGFERGEAPLRVR